MNFYLVPSGQPNPVMAGLVPAIHDVCQAWH